MYKVNRLKSREMFPLVKEIIESGKSVRIMVTGMSMYPFLREGIDSVELTKPNYQKLRRGDIVLIVRDNGQYIMHRVLKKEKDCFYIVGDAQQWVEGPLRPDQLFASVTAVWRKEKYIDCSRVWWRMLTGIWMYLLPFRYIIIKSYIRIRKIAQKLNIRKDAN